MEDHDDFLNLSLSIRVAGSSSEDARAKKRMRRERERESDAETAAPGNGAPLDGSEGKIFKLLQMREEMLKTEPSRGRHRLRTARGST
ncbi:hypothetical protein MLD38_001102 [Melastoma candidum]|uniref:Uncharacterized protein n=1 Tax=Melastoma candidum TaxID=119954 RepID=A0ACB9SD44_9MYRT|nr:hypothetical protein MLD38_001102 [Melastoma candidum]